MSSKSRVGEKYGAVATNGPTATPSAKFHREEHERPMNAFICITCGTQYPPSNTPPARCQVCEDERQYVNWQGQEWTAMDRLGTDHRNVLRDEEPGLTGIRTEPEFAIGQRALLVQTAQGNIPGSTVLPWAAGAGGRGVLLTGDTIYVVSDRRYASFMFSYPNLIPLPGSAIRGLVSAIEPFAFGRLYGGWFERVIRQDAKQAVTRSAQRYIRAIQERPQNT